MAKRTVLVTGGAKRLGARIAEALADQGHRLVIHCRHSVAEAEALANRIGALGIVQGDLADLSDVPALFGRARRVAGGVIDGLVNSASAFTFDRPPEVSARLLADLHSVNAGAPVLLTNALAAQDDLVDGAVVNLLDQKLLNPNPDFFSYSTAKYALGGATVMLDQALGSRIAVNGVAPGIALPSGGQTDEDYRAVASRNPLARPVAPHDVAAAVAYLIGSRGVRAQTLFVDCGQRFVPSARDVMFEAAHG